MRWHRDESPYRQSEIITGLAREAFRSGADWVLPLDAAFQEPKKAFSVYNSGFAKRPLGAYADAAMRSVLIRLCLAARARRPRSGPLLKRPRQ